MMREVITTSIGKVEYALKGKGIPVLFIHGGHSNSHDELFHKGFDLTKYQLITPSRPGYGNTPLGTNQSAKNAADLFVQLLDYLKIDRVILYAVSAGGLTAIEIAANHSERINKLILASAVTKVWLTKNESTYRIAKLIFRPKVEAFTWALVRLFGKLMPRFIAARFYPQFSNKKGTHTLKKEDVMALLTSFKHYNSKEGFLNDIEQRVDHNVLSKIKCPTFIIHSKYDSSVSFEHALHAQAEIRGAILCELANEWGHLFWIGKDSETSIKKVMQFIAQRTEG